MTKFFLWKAVMSVFFKQESFVEVVSLLHFIADLPWRVIDSIQKGKYKLGKYWIKISLILLIYPKQILAGY